MSFLLLLTVILVAVIVLSKPKRPSGVNDDDAYARGYWDGYRAFGEKVQTQLDASSVDRERLQQYVDEGVTGVPAFETSALSADNETTAPTVTSPTQASASAETTTRNLNVLLYMASFLLVAAGVALVSSALSASAKLLGVWALVAVFYGGGLWLHTYMERLRPAALAFIGTGLALIPFGGMALEWFGGVPADVAWLLTSLIGIGMTAYVALRLYALIVSYLTLGFMLSFATSMVATASATTVWYFVVLIGVSLGASLVSFLKPAWLPGIFAEPVERTGQIVTPVALGAGLLLGEQLSLREHQVIVAAATAHYLVAWLQTKHIGYEHAVRVLVHGLLLLVVWELTDGQPVPFGLAFLALTTLQMLYSLLRVREYVAAAVRTLAWPVGIMAAQFVGMSWWVGAEHAELLVAVSFMIIGLTSIAAGYVWRHVGLLVPSLLASLVLPALFGRSIALPPLDWVWLAAFSLALAVGLLYFYWRYGRRYGVAMRQFIAAAANSHLVLAGICAVVAGRVPGGVLLLALAVAWWLASYVYRLPQLVGLSWVAYLTGLMLLWNLFYTGTAALWVGVWLLAAATMYGLSWLLTRDRRRRDVTVGVTWVSLFFAIMIGAVDTDLARLSAGILLAGAATVALEGAWRRKVDLIEAGGYLGVAGLQWLTAQQWPGLDTLVYVHWWALAIAAAALWRHQYLPRLTIAMGLLTFFGAVFALGEGGGYSLLFMAEHVALLVIGVVLARSWAIWWGVIAASLAVLYALRDVAWLAFGFLGLLLIGFVIWRLQHAAK